MYYVVYKVTNQINKKIYIGAHQTEDLNDNYMGSGTDLLRARKKHGIKNFRRKNLFVYDNREDMHAKEEELVNEKFVARKNTYNINIGGIGAPSYTENLRQGRETQSRLLKESPEYLARIGGARSKRGKEFHANGGVNGFQDKKHSEESKAKMRQSKKGKGAGKKNSQYGTMWIYNLGLAKNKKIKKEELALWEEQGWIKGRKSGF